MFTYDDIVTVKAAAPAECRPGAKAWVIGVFAPEYRIRMPMSGFPEGTVYRVEFEGGDTVDIHESWLELVGDC